MARNAFVSAVLMAAIIGGCRSAGVDPAAARPETVVLFDGATFAGWEGNLAFFRVQDGAIVGGSLEKPAPRNEFLCTTREFADFELTFEARLLGPATNGGVQIRSRRIPDHHEMRGYQVDMSRGTPNYWGCLYDESRRNKVLAGPPPEIQQAIVKPDGWNTYVVRCQGRRIELRLNGVKTVDYVEPDESLEQTGLIGLQLHGGPPGEVWYRNLVLTPLPPAGE
ncbi:MAG TPA: DUF1080 domain-containing protein [Planctomycetota bacterium]|jgi:hypothetical protein|nr:DUF1080 domain-containing protein [Planctomycetota bacterium]OQC21437.1 MAG: hypothetical protein BWX69_00923 [Planctomycetes bacterium ADurb.Bin069]NMD34636.1 DUF1080 domain-containing protein [Planctomycetota bacterium]HNR97804.1 DUF1080 domain-containing protein [Planctomycetota bacterium]HNU24729.1 DUF1080 domain-containing protein [Planctomycetota bacterium]